MVVVSLLISLSCYAQVLQVVTKSVEQSFDFTGKEKVQLYAERSDIEINTWSKNTIKIALELSAKHPERTVAEKDLKALQHIIQKSGKSILVRNYISLSTNTPKPQSNLKAKYILYLPANCGIEVSNTFGVVNIRNLESGLYLKTDFCQINLAAIKGKSDIQTYFGILKINELEGKTIISTDRTDIIIRAPKGELTLHTAYGSLDMEADKNVVKLKIDTKNTEMRGATLANKNIY